MKFKKEDLEDLLYSLTEKAGGYYDNALDNASFENDNIDIILISDNNSILIGKDGKTLKSLQILIRQSLLIQTNINIKINLDVANYKAKKIKNMKYEVKKIAKDVLKSHIDAKLDPMNSYERRIVHNMISEYENLQTESIGEEPNRYVLIKYKED